MVALTAPRKGVRTNSNPPLALSRNTTVGVEPTVPRRLTYHRAIRSGLRTSRSTISTFQCFRFRR